MHTDACATDDNAEHASAPIRECSTCHRPHVVGAIGNAIDFDEYCMSCLLVTLDNALKS